MYNCTRTYGTCKSFGSVYSFCINIYGRSCLPVLTIKNLINKYGNATTPFKLVTGTKSSVSNLQVLFLPCVVQKATTHFGTKALNMRYQAQKCFCGICVGIPQHQKGYLVYVPHTRNIISSYDVVLMKVYLVCWHINHNHMQKRWLYDRLCNTYLMIHLQGKKLAI